MAMTYDNMSVYEHMLLNEVDIKIVAVQKKQTKKLVVFFKKKADSFLIIR